LTLDELAAAGPASRAVLEAVMREELAGGRVTRNAAGSYALVAEQFDPEVLAALRQL
jgi:hypothetical protein